MQRKESAGAPPLPSRPAVDSPLTSFPPRSASLPQHDSIQQRVNTAEVIVDDAMSKVVEHIRSEVLGIKMCAADHTPASSPLEAALTRMHCIAATDDYTALQNMTTVARDQYAEYSEIVQGLVAGMGKVQQNCMYRPPHLNYVLSALATVMNARYLRAVVSPGLYRCGNGHVRKSGIRFGTASSKLRANSNGTRRIYQKAG